MKQTYNLSKKINLTDIRRMKILLRELKLSTVCEEAKCPNIGECFSKNIAAFMILGNVCIRGCRFCGVKKGTPLPWDPDEPLRIKEAVKILKLKYVVITSPSRDDMEDSGAGAYASTISAIKSLNFVKKVEALIPDLSADKSALHKIITAPIDVIAHNLETVPSLYLKIRPQADYRRSLKVLTMIKESNPRLITKSGIMLGLGEKKEEVIKVFNDLANVGCDFLSIGQYLAPSLSHYPVKEYLSPDEFSYFRKMAKSAGLKYVLSFPYVRSSYRADTYRKDGFNQGNVVENANY